MLLGIPVLVGGQMAQGFGVDLPLVVGKQELVTRPQVFGRASIGCRPDPSQYLTCDNSASNRNASCADASAWLIDCCDLPSFSLASCFSDSCRSRLFLARSRARSRSLFQAARRLP